MRHLVISVSPESSLKLLGEFADVILLDTEPPPTNVQHYDTLYIRSHFGQPTTLPQLFRSEIDYIVKQARNKNPAVTFIDGVDTIEKIVEFEDKWLQYVNLSDFMPKTQLLSDTNPAIDFERPIFKKRLSSRGTGVTWDVQSITGPREEWIAQQSLTIAEELRIYTIRGNICEVTAVRQSMTEQQKTQAVSARPLAQDEIDFAAKVALSCKELDVIGLDIVRTLDRGLYVIEANRSPGFGAFFELTGINLAKNIYEHSS